MIEKSTPNMKYHHQAKVSVVIAVHNEENTIADVVTKVRKALGNETQIVVVDDGSTDKTAHNARRTGADVVQLNKNMGKGVALKRGFALATGDFILTIDGDGQDNPDDLVPVLEAAKQGADLVIGSRFIGELHHGAITPLDLLGNRFFTAVINLLFQPQRPVTDSQAGVRCFSKTLLDKIDVEAKEYEVETEMLIKALKQGAKVVEVPVHRYPRGGGKSGFRRIRHGLRIAKTILKLKTR